MDFLLGKRVFPICFVLSPSQSLELPLFSILKRNHLFYAACDLTSKTNVILCFSPWYQICYFFYKNITFGLTLFYFEALTSFSGQTAYNDWYMSLFNVFFTSLPVIALGVFEQDVSSRVCLQVWFFLPFSPFDFGILLFSTHTQAEASSHMI